MPGELLHKVENKSPVHDSFQFQKVADKLQIASDYLLQYILQPNVPCCPIIMAGSRLTVKPGRPSKLSLEVPSSHAIDLATLALPIFPNLPEHVSNAKPAEVFCLVHHAISG